jgi:hypothetical protein
VSDWLTYEAAASRFGISAEAVRQLAIRHKWPRRRPNNDPYGRVEIAVPVDFEARPRPTVQHPSERLSDARSTPDADTLRDALEREQKRADAAEKRADAADLDRRKADEDRRAAEARADQAEQSIAAERARADAAEGRADRAEARAAGLRDRLDAAELARREAEDATKHARSEAQEAHQSAEALRQADDARRAKGRWARLRAAWQGE